MVGIFFIFKAEVSNVCKWNLSVDYINFVVINKKKCLWKISYFEQNTSLSWISF